MKDSNKKSKKSSSDSESPVKNIVPEMPKDKRTKAYKDWVKKYGEQSSDSTIIPEMPKDKRTKAYKDWVKQYGSEESPSKNSSKKDGTKKTKSTEPKKTKAKAKNTKVNLEDLVTCVHIIQLKILTAMRVGQKQKKIDINIPKGARQGMEFAVKNKGNALVYGGLCGFYALLCQDEQGEKIYENPEYNTCYLYTVGRDEVTEDNTSIIYNRDLSSIVVKLQDKSDMAILITDISGKILYKTEVNSKKETIPFRINNPGIYIVTVVVNSQKTSIKLMYY